MSTKYRLCQNVSNHHLSEVLIELIVKNYADRGWYSRLLFNRRIDSYLKQEYYLV